MFGQFQIPAREDMGQKVSFSYFRFRLFQAQMQDARVFSFQFWGLLMLGFCQFWDRNQGMNFGRQFWLQVWSLGMRGFIRVRQFWIQFPIYYFSADFFYSWSFFTVSSTSGFSFFIFTGTSDIELDTNVNFFDLANLRKASSGAFRGKTLFYVLGKGFKLVNVVLGA